VAVELSEKELADLRAKAEAADKAAEREAELTKKHQEYEQKLVAANKKYDDDMKQVAAYLQQQNQPPPEKKEEEDPDAIVSRADLRKAQEASERRQAEQSAQHSQLLLRNQRNINKQLAAQRLGPRAEKYMAEIDAHLDKLDPSVAAQPTAYDEVFKYVRAAHFDEELAEAQKAREDEGGEAESSESGSSTSPAPSRPVPRTESVSPGSQANAARPIARSQAARPRLTDEQRRVAAGFGMSDEDYAGKWGTDDEMQNNDPYGLQGRKRV
jgi:hypothetical protein